MNVTIRVNFGSAVQTLRAMRTAFTAPMPPPMRVAFTEVADRFDGWTAERYDRRSEFGGVGEWPKLAPSTVAEKRRKGVDNGILIRTRAMRRSVDPGGANHVRVNLPNGVRTGSADPKIKRHQTGGGKLPARPVYSPPSPQLVRELTGIMAAGMRKVIAAARAASPQVPGVSNPPSTN